MIGTLDFNPGNATLGVLAAGSGGIMLTGSFNDISLSMSVTIQPPSGAVLAVGTYSTHRSPDATHAGLETGIGNAGCNTDTGSVTISELTRDPGTQAITAIAATYHQSCIVGLTDVSGEMRWNSTVDYEASAATPYQLDFGDQLVHQDSAPRSVTVHSDGTVPVQLGAVDLGGNTPQAFAVTGDTCTGATLNPGETCQVTVVAHPSFEAGEDALIRIDTSSVGGHIFLPLAVTGADPQIEFSPSSLAFGAVKVGTDSTPIVVTVQPAATQVITMGTVSITGPDAAAFTITDDQCSGVEMIPGFPPCTVTVKAHPGDLLSYAASLSLPNNTALGPFSAPLTVTGASGAAGTYYPVPPSRILDTRSGLGAPKAALGAGGVLHLQVTGKGGVAAGGVSAVVLNVTVTGPTAASFLAVYPTGSPRPTVSSLNFPRGWTGANNVTVPVGTNGKVDIYNLTGSTQVIADVLGYYAADDTVIPAHGIGGRYVPVVPERLLDTRRPPISAPLPGHTYVVIPVDYGADANSHIRALAVNVTAVNPHGSGYLTTWNGQGAVPTASTVNFVAHAVVPNLAVVPVAGCTIDPSCGGFPAVAVYNGSASATDVVVDIVGFFDDGTLPDGLTFHAITPQRIVDTRAGLGAPTAIGPKATAVVTTPGTVADANTVALAANVTAVAPTASTFLSVWPADAGLSQPTVSTVNAVAGQIVPNAALITIGPSAGFNIFNNAGNTNVLVDVAGVFDFGSAGAASLGTRQLTSHLFVSRPQTIGQ